MTSWQGSPTTLSACWEFSGPDTWPTRARKAAAGFCRGDFQAACLRRLQHRPSADNARIEVGASHGASCSRVERGAALSRKRSCRWPLFRFPGGRNRHGIHADRQVRRLSSAMDSAASARAQGPAALRGPCRETPPRPPLVGDANDLRIAGRYRASRAALQRSESGGVPQYAWAYACRAEIYLNYCATSWKKLTPPGPEPLCPLHQRMRIIAKGESPLQTGTSCGCAVRPTRPCIAFSPHQAARRCRRTVRCLTL